MQNSEAHTYIFPLFKFLKKKYTEQLLRKGSIRIGTLYDYRKEEHHNGKTLDTNEGTKCISFRKDGSYRDNELEKLGFPIGNGIISMCNSTIQSKQKSSDLYLYPTSQYFFNDSLFQAIEDEKDSCILIKNPDLFFKIISKELNDSEYKGYHKCEYIGRKHEITDIKKRHPIVDLHPALLKPESYKNQMEVRAIWMNKTNKELEPKVLPIPEVSKLCIEVNFDNLDVELLKKENCRIKYEVIKNNDEISSFSISSPSETYTPVIVNSMLGFIPQSTTAKFKNPCVSNAEIGVMVSDIGPIFCNNSVDSIKEIRFSTS